jgi:hypothetical protein
MSQRYVRYIFSCDVMAELGHVFLIYLLMKDAEEDFGAGVSFEIRVGIPQNCGAHCEIDAVEMPVATFEENRAFIPPRYLPSKGYYLAYQGSTPI